MSFFLTLAPTAGEADDPNAPAGGIAIVQSASGTTADGSAGLTVPFGAAVVTAAATGQGTYTYTGQHSNRPYFNISGTNPELSSISYDGTRWKLHDGAGVVYRTTANSNLLPWETATWTDQGGGLPVPIINCSASVTTGNSVIALISVEGTGGFSSPPTFIGGGAAVLSAVVSQANGFTTYIYKKTNATGGETGITFTTNDAVRASMQILEVSGLADAAAEATASASGTNTDVLIDGFSNTTPIALAVAIGAWNANNYNNGPADGWTRIGTGMGGASVWQESAYKILSVAEPQGTSWTLDPAADFAVAAAVFGGA